MSDNGIFFQHLYKIVIPPGPNFLYDGEYMNIQASESIFLKYILVY